MLAPSRLIPSRADGYAETLLENLPLVLGRDVHCQLRHHIVRIFHPVSL
jgi:hypothetical protein